MREVARLRREREGRRDPSSALPLTTEEIILEGLVLTEELLGGISAAFPHTHKLRFHCCVAQVEGRGGGEEGGEGMGSERAMSGEEGRGEDRIRGGR